MTPDAVVAVDPRGDLAACLFFGEERSPGQQLVLGKLVQLDQPKLALVVRGQVDLPKETSHGKDGWTAVVFARHRSR